MGLNSAPVSGTTQGLFMQLISTSLDSGWELAERLPAGRDLFLLSGGEKLWLPATVPGHVHTDLVKAGVIADPFKRLAEWGARWVIVEGRESGAGVGVYGDQGEIDGEGLETFARVLGDKIDRLIWEAPLKHQQTALIERRFACLARRQR